MSNILKKFDSLFSNDMLRCLQNGDIIDIAQLNAIITLLIKANHSFILTFEQATNNTVATAQLEITLTPTVTITLLLPFERGPVFEFV